jgi:sulfoxide reductase catalytic subunit YedY
MPELPSPAAAEPLRASLTTADDSVRRDHWMVPQPICCPKRGLG